MNPEKLKKIGYAALGVWLLCAGVLAYFAYDGASARAEAEETLEDENLAFRRFNEAPVFPSRVSIEGVKSNELAWSAWYDAAFSIAGRGDRELPAESAPVFKQRLQAAVRRLQALPGEVDGRLAPSSFFFGFEDFLGEKDSLPKDADIPQLAAQLDFIEHFAELLAEAGVITVKSLSRIAPNPDDGECARHLDYKVVFSTRPAGLVRTMNALASSPRFVSVSGFSFKEPADSITARLSSDGQKKDNLRRGGRRGRRGSQSAENPGEEEPAESRIVTDPAANAVFDVTMTVKVYDFRARPEEETSAAKKKKRGAR